MNKKQNKIKGNFGESIAADYCNKIGYKILQRNFSCKCGEVDVIALDDETIVFMEVKYRQSTRYGTPGQAVNNNKRKHIINTALFYLQKNHLFDHNVRFDIFEVLDINGIIKTNHIKNAFNMIGFR